VLTQGNRAMLRVIYRTPVPPGISELFPWSRSVLTDRRGQRDRRTDGRTDDLPQHTAFCRASRGKNWTDNVRLACRSLLALLRTELPYFSQIVISLSLKLKLKKH